MLSYQHTGEIFDVDPLVVEALDLLSETTPSTQDVLNLFLQKDSSHRGRDDAEISPDVISKITEVMIVRDSWASLRLLKEIDAVLDIKEERVRANRWFLPGILLGFLNATNWYLKQQLDARHSVESNLCTLLHTVIIESNTDTSICGPDKNQRARISGELKLWIRFGTDALGIIDNAHTAIVKDFFSDLQNTIAALPKKKPSTLFARELLEQMGYAYFGTLTPQQRIQLLGNAVDVIA